MSSVRSRKSLSWWAQTPLFAARLARHKYRVMQEQGALSGWEGLGDTAQNAENAIVSELAKCLEIKGYPVQQWAVDLGAASGVELSNTLPLFRAGWNGLAVEYDPSNFALLAARYARFPQVDLVRTRITPENVVALLAAHDIPRELGILSLDIDSYDHFVLESVLKEFRPSLVLAEINLRFPPPLRFTVLPNDNPIWNGGILYGQSLQMLHEQAGKHGYGIVKLEYNNAFLVPCEFGLESLSADDAWRTGFLERPDRQTKFPFHADFEPVFHMTSEQALLHMNEQLRDYEGQFQLSLVTDWGLAFQAI